MIQGGFGIPTGWGGNVQVLGPGETLGSGLDYSIDLLSPPWDGYVSLNVHVVQDYFYEYALPDGSVFRDLAGELNGDLHFAGTVPAVALKSVDGAVLGRAPLYPMTEDVYPRPACACSSAG